MKTHVAFVIRRLDRGGAERQLVELAHGLDKNKFDVTIVTFYPGGDFASEIRQESGINIVCLNKRGPWDTIGFLARFLGALRHLRPHIVHGYLAGANELSVLGGRVCGARVVWGLRASGFNNGDMPVALSERCLFRAGALLSSWADRIIANSECTRSFHRAGRYCDARLTVIPNGINTETFSILPQQRARVRHEWGIRDDEILIGRAARLAPMKDYPAFFKAAGLVYRQQPNVRFACVGDGTDCAELFQLAAAEGLEERMTWAGGRRDMPAVYNALDICVSSSRFSEGFPNTVAEAMACGTPCVATRTGDSEQIVGDMGIIVPPCDAALLADGITRLIATLHSHPRERVRARIVSHFSLERLTSRTAAEFETVLIQ